MKKFHLIALFALIVIGFASYDMLLSEKRSNDGFAVEKIASEIPNSRKWEINIRQDDKEKANALLRQPFYYLGHGFQCYAFISQDGLYVLKFPRHQRLRPPAIYNYLPDVWPLSAMRERKEEMRKRRANYLFQSLKVAYEDVSEETGLVFVHVNKTDNEHPMVAITDKIGNTYQVSLDDKEFILQKKATHIKAVLWTLMKEGKKHEAQTRITQIFDHLKRCAKKGVLDTDGALIHKNNLGFLEDRAIYIDLGKLTRRESIKTKDRFEKDLKRLRPLRKWLFIHFPDLANYFDRQQKKTIEEFDSE